MLVVYVFGICSNHYNFLLRISRLMTNNSANIFILLERASLLVFV